jgi:hypothetical protein
MTRRSAVVVLAGAARAADGWRPLFDGSTTSGWLEITGKPFPANCWNVEDGALHTLVRTGFQDIRTVDEFASFDLRFEWKIGSKGNSGLKYLIQRVDEWTNAGGRQARARGLEYQLADDANDDAASDPNRRAGSLYSLLAPSPRVAPGIGEYNQSRLLVDGRRVEHWLNGVKVLAFRLDSPEVERLLRTHLPKDAASGAPLAFRSPISLQNHASEAWFRNLEIRPL